MALKIRIPFLLNAAFVNDESEMAWLNNEPAIRRELSGKGGLINWLVWKRLDRLVMVGSSRRLPTFEPRDNVERAKAQEETALRLSDLAASPQPFDRDAIATLGQYVAGGAVEQPIGVTVQQIVGRLFDPTYDATRESYEDAQVVATAIVKACPMALLRTLWWRLSGRLAASRERLWTLANNDPIVIHATTIAIHNIVDSLDQMRAAMRADGPWQATAAAAAAETLVTPRRLMRECPINGAMSGGLRPGTLVVFKLARMHAGTASNDLAFSRKEWSQCPAYALVPRLLEEVWTAAVRERGAVRYREPSPLLGRLLTAPIVQAYAWLNRRVVWYRLPKWIAFFNLWALREVLRARNLVDTSLLPTKAAQSFPPANPDVLRWRTADGSYNDLRDPSMGRAGTRFGRNVPLGYTYPDQATLLDPNPRVVSRTLLTRREFIPAPSLNVLAAAWIQFQVHDWFSHGDPDFDDPISIDVEASDPWPGTRPMLVGRTVPDATRSDDPPVGPPTHLNTVTHWWDASQLYGSDLETQTRVRTAAGGELAPDGKLALDPGGRIPRDPATGIEVTGFNKNWWLGLSLLHQLFTLEHNAICDRLRAEYPQWDNEQLFQTARLINAALITKIHDLDWGPAILRIPAVQQGFYASWWGLLGKRFVTTFGRQLPNLELATGIPGSRTEQHAAPYAITEEFVSVYRMHPFMMPEQFEIYSVEGGGRLTTLRLSGILGRGAGDMVTKFGELNLLYSFGRIVPGALRLGNYSPTLQQLQQPAGSGPIIDLATVDIVRDRERGVPRYNRFRELLRLPPVRSFKELNSEWADTLEAVYRTVDRIDLMVGLLAETLPPGFAFGDTTFRIFLLMNSRRLKSDRFYTTDYTPAVYTQAGIDWINANDMRSVLLRHYPMLEWALKDVANVFGPGNAKPASPR